MATQKQTFHLVANRVDFLKEENTFYIQANPSLSFFCYGYQLLKSPVQALNELRSNLKLRVNLRAFSVKLVSPQVLTNGVVGSISAANTILNPSDNPAFSTTAVFLKEDLRDKSRFIGEAAGQGFTWKRGRPFRITFKLNVTGDA